MSSPSAPGCWEKPGRPHAADIPSLASPEWVGLMCGHLILRTVAKEGLEQSPPHHFFTLLYPCQGLLFIYLFI